MGYQFKLEALMNFRKFQEEKVQKEMAEAQRIRDQEAEKLKELIGQSKQTENDLKLKQQEGASGPCLSIYSNYLAKLVSDIFSQQHVLADAQKILEQKREALLAAMQKRKTLEKLKEKGFKTYMENLSSADQKFINEMAISRFHLKQN